MLLPFPHHYRYHFPSSSKRRTCEISPSKPYQFLAPLSPLAAAARRPPISLVKASVVTPKVLKSNNGSSSSSNSNDNSIIQRIADKLRSLGYIENDQDKDFNNSTSDYPNCPVGSGSPGQIFVPAPNELPKYRVGHTLDPSWSTPERPVPGPGSGKAIVRFNELKREAERQKQEHKNDKRRNGEEDLPMAAELLIPATELRRLRSGGIRIDKKLNVGKAGITEGIVNGIHERWRSAELVKIKCKDLCRMNMKRTHEILERKTGGLVIWRSGSVIILYRGTNYVYPYFDKDLEKGLSSVHELGISTDIEQEGRSDVAVSVATSEPLHVSAHQSLVPGVGSPKRVRFQLPGEAQLEEEANKLLEGLGPRFKDWWGCEPLPVDADLLPAIVPGFRRPFRLLPYGVKSKLTDREMTILRRLSNPLPCHFALGRNRNIQGLAASMIRLWEKCEIAKIAIKRGVQNTNSELMVGELKRLTGGTLLSRNREFIVFYRGKDFLPPAVSKAIEERRNIGVYQKNLSTNEISSVENEYQRSKESLSAEGPRENTVDKPSTQKELISSEGRLDTTIPAETIDAMLSKAYEKKMKAERLLKEIENSAGSPKQESDKEAISEEERYMLRKIGLRMKAFLLLGRRGVFDGTVENMHLHWKYRELVKIISRNRSIKDVHQAARALEAESGGILVAVESVNKGHAIIIYRGKNYQRPKNLRPKTLLNKKAALKRYVESQRSESLKLHILKLSRDIDQLESQLVKHDMQTDISEFTEDIGKFSAFDTSSTTEHPYGLASIKIKSKNRTTESKLSDFRESTHRISRFNNEYQKDEECDPHAIQSMRLNGNYDTSVEILDSGSSSMNRLASPPMLASIEENNISNTEVAPSYTGKIDSDDKNDTDTGKDVLAVSATAIACNDSGESYEVSSDLPHSSRLLVGGSELDVAKYYRTVPLSNKDRLILRKQALQMKKRPVLAVGRNNVVEGVAKTIKTHFRKHPLAIVNIKGIAKGTSVHEVIFELERATGAVLVSREPSKVILYRGWGKGEEPGSVKEKKDTRGTPLLTEKLPHVLVTALKLECGLQSALEGQGTGEHTENTDL